MSVIRHIALVQFRNHPDREFDFDHRITAFTGPNGAGKTGLLDAIHYLCCTRSYFQTGDHQSVRFGGSGFRIEGSFARENQEDVVTCIFRGPGKKEFLLNGNPYGRFSAHVGLFPAVMIAPDDSSILTGAGERRKFLDILLSQMDPLYLEQLIAYNRVLQQRNGHVRNLAQSGRGPDDLLDALDSQLIPPGEFLHAARQSFLEGFLPKAQQIYNHLSGRREEVHIGYRSNLSGQPFSDLLVAARSRDLLLQRTTAGPHRDDLELYLDGHPLKVSGSQGQRKSFLFALKLAEYDLILEKRQNHPLLLLDDVFEKLDQDRISRLLSLICENGFGQVFITDTDQTRLEAAFRDYPDLMQLTTLRSIPE